MTKKTILISTNTSWNIVNFRTGLIRALQAEGYRVISAAPNDAYTPTLEKMVDQHIPLPMENAGISPWHDFILFLRYLRLLHTTKPAAILSYTIKPNIYGTLAARLFGIPIINNVSGLGTAFIRNNWLTTIVTLLYRFAFQSSASVFFQNPEDKDLFIKMRLVKPHQAALLAGSGINLDYFTPIVREPSNTLSFVLIARLLWDKGIGEYVEAARIVKAKHPHVIFRLVGPMGVKNNTVIPEKTIREWVAKGIIQYMGETDDVRTVLAAHDCVVLPSYREGMSRVLLEGAAMGKPLIATNVAGCKHVIDDGVNGLLCRVQDAHDLANILMQFIELSPEKRHAMGIASRKKAEKEFDEKLVFNAYLERIKTAIHQ